MQNSLGIIRKSSVIFIQKVVVKEFSNYNRKNSWKHAEKFRWIKFEICIVFTKHDARKKIVH